MSARWEDMSILESPEDWRVWRDDIERKCSIAGWYHLFYRHKTEPDNTDSSLENPYLDDDEYLTKISWRRQQIKACDRIRGYLGRSALRLVQGKETVSEIMDTLEKKYSYRCFSPPDKTVVLMKLMDDFNSLSLADCNNDISTFTSRLIEIDLDMHLLDKSCTLPEPFWINKLLDGLGPDYESFVTSFRSNCNYFPEKDENGVVTKEAATLDSATMEAVRAERIIKRAKEYPCEQCGGERHLVEDCWELHPYKRPTKRRRK